MHKNFKDNIFVGMQGILFAVFFLQTGYDYHLPDMLKYAGILLFLTGCLIVLTAMIQLNKNLTAFPTPKERAALYTSGLYSVVRHPIYTGVILIFIGLSFFWISLYKLLISIALVILFYFKTAYEEKQLEIKYEGYGDYKIKTSKFFPGF